jgi:ComF family protein
VWSSLFRALGGFAAEVIAPRGCAACDDALAARAVFCAACAATLVLDGEQVGGVWAATAYGGALSTAVHRLKYEGRGDLGAQLGELLRRVDVGPFDRVVPVPLHPSRLAERGFNQAALLARPIADARPFGAGDLERTRATPQQMKLPRAERLRSVVGAFRAGRRVASARVLLIDDVVTTGATFAACEAALLEAGARSVTCLALARAGAETAPASS